MGKFTESNAKSGIVTQVKTSFQWPTGSENTKRKGFFLFCNQIFRHQFFGRGRSEFEKFLMISHLNQLRNFNIHSTASSSFISLQQVVVILFTTSNIDLPLSPVSQWDMRSSDGAQKNDAFFFKMLCLKRWHVFPQSVAWIFPLWITAA